MILLNHMGSVLFKSLIGTYEHQETGVQETFKSVENETKPWDTGDGQEHGWPMAS